MKIYKTLVSVMFVAILGMSGYCIASGQTLPFSNTNMQNRSVTQRAMNPQITEPDMMRNQQPHGGMSGQPGRPANSNNQQSGFNAMTERMRPDNMNISNRPVPQGNPGRPSLDRETFNEAASEGSLTQCSDRSFVYTLGDVQASDYATFDSYMTMLESQHSSLVNKYLSEGWKVVLTTADLDELLFHGSTQNVVGATVSSSKTIYVESGQYSYCVIHEFGHYMDYKLGMISEKNDFSSIYASEGNNLSEYGKTDSTEFFAEAYMYSIIKPDTLSANCPQAYSYIEKCKNSI